MSGGYITFVLYGTWVVRGRFKASLVTTPKGPGRVGRKDRDPDKCGPYNFSAILTVGTSFRGQTLLFGELFVGYSDPSKLCHQQDPHINNN